VAAVIGRAVIDRQRFGLSVLVASALLLSGSAIVGCGVVTAVKTVASNVEGNKNTIDTFTKTMRSGEVVPFEVTYVTTGTSPATIVYAVRPPKDLLFTDTSSGGTTGTGAIDLIVNASGEFSCPPAAPASSKASTPVRTCEKLGAAQADAQKQILNLYTPAHWVAFLQGLSIAAGFAGDKVTQSQLTLNGFAMRCVDFQASGIPGTSTICTTAQGILGYVKVASEPTSFEIKSYSATPAASLFDLPLGAKVRTA
jgi:hypothetical protein